MDRKGIPEILETRSVAGTVAAGRRIGESLSAGDCVALVGELGSGKTVLVRGIAAGLGVPDERVVTSPTYVLVQEYPGRCPVHHVDLYRLTDPPAELAGLGIEEMLEGGVVLIEWADRAGPALPTPRLEVTLEATGRRTRRVTIRRVQ